MGEKWDRLTPGEIKLAYEEILYAMNDPMREPMNAFDRLALTVVSAAMIEEYDTRKNALLAQPRTAPRRRAVT